VLLAAVREEQRVTAGSVPAAVAFGRELARASAFAGDRAGTGRCSARLTCRDMRARIAGEVLKFLRNVFILRQIRRMWEQRRRT
jgi:hypothetical protein